MYVHLFMQFKIIQCILKYKCICIYILSYYTYSNKEYLDSLFVNNTLSAIVFSCFPHLHLPCRVLLSTHMG